MRGFVSRGRFFWILPAAVAVLAYANTLAPSFGDAVYTGQYGQLTLPALRDSLFASPWHPVERSYTPTTILSYMLNSSLGDGPWPFHIVNVLLHAAASVVAYFLLRELLGDALLAALGGGLYAALGIHTEAVASIAGRADMLAGLALLTSWLIALVNSRIGPHQREKTRLAFAASFILFLGLFARWSIATIILLIPITIWILRRRIPWVTLASCASAIAGYFLIRGFYLGQGPPSVIFADNPLVAADLTARILNAIKIVGLYITKIILPLRLSADYSFDEIPVLSSGDLLLWLRALAVFLPLLFIALYFRKRKPPLTLAIAFFAAAVAPFANIFFLIGSIFSERFAYAPAFAYPLALCAIIAGLSGRRWRGVALGLLAVLTVLYGVSTARRNRDWAVPVALRIAEEAPRSARAQVIAADAMFRQWFQTQQLEERKVLRDRILQRLLRSREILPGYGPAEAMEGKLRFQENDYDEAIARFTKAEEYFKAQGYQVSDPDIYQLRGKCYMARNRHEDAVADFSLFLDIREGAAAVPDPRIFNRRGLAYGQLGKLKEALRDFNTAVALDQESPEYRNNRGFCRFQLKDHEGAIRDYEWGREACFKQKLLYAPQGESVWLFDRRIADVYASMAVAQRAAGKEKEAKEAEEKASEWKQKAAKIAVPSPETKTR